MALEVCCDKVMVSESKSSWSKKSSSDVGGVGQEVLEEEVRDVLVVEDAEGADDDEEFSFVGDEDDNEDEFCCTKPPLATALPWDLRRPPAERRKVSATTKHCRPSLSNRGTATGPAAGCEHKGGGMLKEAPPAAGYGPPGRFLSRLLAEGSRWRAQW